MTIIIFTLLAIIISLSPCCTVHSIITQHPLRIMPPRTVRLTQNSGRRRQDDRATATVASQKEKASENINGPNAMNIDNPMEVEENWPPLSLAVVSPPSAPNLTSLLTGHTGQEVGPQAGDEGTAPDKNNHSQENVQVEDNLKSPIKKKSKKAKLQQMTNQRNANKVVRVLKRARTHPQ